MPDHCYYSPENAPEDATVDFKVAFNPFYAEFNDQNQMYPNYKNERNTFNTETAYNDFICDGTWPSDNFVPSTYGYELQQASINADMTYVVGVALNGVLIQSANAENGYDAFYPTAVNDRLSPARIDQDLCLGSSAVSTPYHYYMNSPCIYSRSDLKTQNSGPCSGNKLCNEDPLSYTLSFTSEGERALLPIGIAKDGHLIYGPYKNDGTLWQPNEVDACNGYVYQGQYIYVSTQFHPYTIGCWGPGNFHNFD